MKIETAKKIRAVGIFLFTLYLILLIYFLFFAESYGRVSVQREYRYNLELFKEIQRFGIIGKSLDGLRYIICGGI